MMKKVIKKLLAALLAVAMVCAMAVPAFADNTENIRDHHSFEAFQIFKGDVTGNDINDFKISKVKWGKNITNPTDFLKELMQAPIIGAQFQSIDATDATNAATAQDVLAVISKWSTSDDDSIAFARFVCHYLYSGAVDQGDSIPSGGDVVHIPINEAGYYLIVDTTDFSTGDSYHACNSFLLNVTKAPYDLPIKPKAEKPTVEKEVHDNDNNDISSAGNNDGWGSSADHAINEKFQFRLIAKLPKSSDRAYDYYHEYAVLFNDTLSDGITYDKDDNLDSVVIESNGKTYDITDESSKYKVDDSHLKNDNSFVVSIPDVKTCVEDPEFNLNNGATITVTYTAHLNETAYVNTASSDTKNNNSVYLQYSNNPKDESSIGKTPESKVCVYTYQLNNTKLAESEYGVPLKGAGFRLYSDKACAEEQEVKLYKKDNFYYPIKDATDKAQDAVEMFSDEHGQFNVKGLDAGTYYLRETKTPDDYSACPDKEIVISATHDVNHVSLSGESNLNNKIINIKAGGITLPSTGGIGTTIFYVVGGGLMVAAIVLLVTKKRMENK